MAAAITDREKILKEQGLLDLDTPVGEYLSRFCVAGVSDINSREKTVGIV